MSNSKSSKTITRTMYFELLGAISLCFQKYRNDKTGSKSSNIIHCPYNVFWTDWCNFMLFQKMQKWQNWFKTIQTHYPYNVFWTDRCNFILFLKMQKCRTWFKIIQNHCPYNVFWTDRCHFILFQKCRNDKMVQNHQQLLPIQCILHWSVQLYFASKMQKWQN